MKYLAAIILSIISLSTAAADVEWATAGMPSTYCLETKADMAVTTALDMLAGDLAAVTGSSLKASGRDAVIRIYQLDRASRSGRKRLEAIGIPVAALDTLTDGFSILAHDGHVYVAGSNGRGTAYGILELSRLAGVSPWVWWGDVTPERRASLTLPDGFATTQGASVEYRGVFINDEDWSTRPWSCTTFEPGEYGVIGPKTYGKIFRLLMRLRANAIWPAMHEGTQAFFKNPLNKLMADSCGIAVGSSHCEPLLRNNVDEWDYSRGRYNYITNRDAVHDYWRGRLKQVKDSQGGNLLTIGMRGIHDSSMEGTNTPQEKFDALQQVIDDQQRLIAENLGDPSAVTQIFIPYKEVLELYEKGLKVPDYVTLMWCDDNYGYMTRLSNEAEQRRSGGAGVYYHLSYWGRPHDYLWLCTTSPGLILNEMRTAYDHNVRKIWIANVHDPKVAAYDLELFLDLAWNIDCVAPDKVGDHLKSWLTSNFGAKAAEGLYPAMRSFYRLCAQRRPEFMGWSQVELNKKYYQRGLSPVANTEFSFTEFGDEADRYLDDFQAVAAAVDSIEPMIAPERADAYFAAIKYPVKAACAHAVKLLEAQRARMKASGGSGPGLIANEDAVCEAAARSQDAYQSIRRLTDYYNNVMAGGKWRRSMTLRPRDLPVYAAPSLPVALTDAEVSDRLAARHPQAYHAVVMDGAKSFAAADYASSRGKVQPVDMLGHSGHAVAIDKGASLTYSFETDSADIFRQLTVALIPTQPNDNGPLRFAVSIDDGAPAEFDLREPFRSEQWKQNVLRGQARRSIALPSLGAGQHSITVTALDPHIILDQLLLDTSTSRRHYLIPQK